MTNVRPVTAVHIAKRPRDDTTARGA
jgi:hypothetical protein